MGHDAGGMIDKALARMIDETLQRPPHSSAFRPWCRRSEVPDSLAAKSGSGTSDRKRYWNHRFAGAHDFPKFVNGRAAMEHELRKAGTRKRLKSAPIGHI